MEIIIRDMQPNPPKEVVITMTVKEARDLHNACYARSGGSQDNALGPLRGFVDALTTAGVQHPRNN